MDKKKTPSIKNSDVLLLSFFGVGLFPWAPGTAGSLAILPILFLLGVLGVPPFLLIPILVIFTVIFSFLADTAQKKYRVHDPSWIVIDEVLGMSITWLFCSRHDLLELIIAFAFFRFFDIVKVWPASWFDQKVTHGAGTILDDVVSGFYAGLMIFGFFHWLWPLIP